MNGMHPALVAALASATQDTGPREGVHVRAACGFAPTAPFTAEVTTMTPVGPIIQRAEGAWNRS